MLATVRGDLSPVLRCPAILLGGVHPVPDVRVTIPEMEGQLPCAGHLDMVDPLGKGLLIKCFKAHRTGGFLQDDPVRDFLPDAAPALLFSRPACPGFHLLWLKSTLCPVEPLAVHVALPAEGAFDFSRQEAGVQGLVGQRAKLPAPGHFGLHIIEGLLVDDRFMGVGHKVLRKLPAILLLFLRDGIGGEFLLQE